MLKQQSCPQLWHQVGILTTVYGTPVVFFLADPEVGPVLAHVAHAEQYVTVLALAVQGERKFRVGLHLTHQFQVAEQVVVVAMVYDCLRQM